IYDIGVLANVLQLLKLPDGTVKVLVEGKTRAKVQRFTERKEYYEAEAVQLEAAHTAGRDEEALVRAVTEQFDNYIKLKKKIPPEALQALAEVSEADVLADSIAAHLVVKIAEKQALLEELSVSKRLEKIY